MYLAHYELESIKLKLVLLLSSLLLSLLLLLLLLFAEAVTRTCLLLCAGDTLL